MSSYRSANLKRSLVRIPILFALLLVLAGCWPLPGEPASPSGTPQPGATSGVPGDADALDIAGQTEDPPTIDPALASDEYSMFVIRQLFSGLVAYDDNLNVVPDLAASPPSVSANGTTYTFVLRKGVQFSDGQEVTSSDVKYSFERATDPKLAGSQPASSLPSALFLGDIVGVQDKLAGKTKDISGIQTPDPYTVVITIDQPKAYFLSKLTAGPAFVVERSNVEGANDWTEHPRGSGPFRLEKWVHNQQMALVANDKYYAGAPRVPRLNIWMGANSTGELQQYETGGLDVADVGVDDIERVSDRNNPMSKELQTVPDMAVTYLGFNLRQKPLDDPKIRQAISMAIDRQKIARVMFQSRVRQADTFMPPNMAGYTPPNVGETYDVTRARQLITESTYKDVKNLPRLRLYTSGDALGPMLHDVLSQTLGIDLEVHEVEWTDFLAGLDRHDYPVFTLTWSADFPDPESMLGSLFRSISPANYTGYKNVDVDSALDSAATDTNTARRMATYAQIEQQILSDYPAVPLYHSVRYTLVKPYVQDFKVTPVGILSLKNVRLVAP